MQGLNLTLGWAFWRQHRLGWLLMLGWLTFLIVLTRTIPVERLGALIPALAFLPFGCAVLYLIAAVCHAHEVDLTAGHSGYPRRFFTLPVPTWQLVLWPMGVGVIGVWVLWLGIVYGIDWPGWRPPAWCALWLALPIATCQALAWWPFGIKVVRLVAMMFTGATLFAAVIATSELDVPRRLIILGLITSWVVAVIIAWIGVHLARHGWTFMQPAGVARPVQMTTSSARTAVAPRSPMMAQMWFERRRQGVLVYPLVGAVWLTVCLLFLATTLEDMYAVFTQNGVLPTFPGLSVSAGFTLTFCFMMLLSPMMASLGFGLQAGDMDRRGRSTSEFDHTRPLRTLQLVLVRSRFCAIMSLWTTLQALGLLTAWLIVTDRTAELTEIRQAWGRDLPAWRVLLGMATVVFLMFIGNWGASQASMWIGLTGRRGVMYTGVGFGLALVIGSGFTLEFGSESLSDLLIFLAQNSVWLAVGVLMVKIAITVGGFALTRRLGLITTQEGLLGVGLWGGLVLGFFLALVLGGITRWMSVPACVIILVITIPLNRITLAALALKWNRNR